jgi:hypothetical protein
MINLKVEIDVQNPDQLGDVLQGIIDSIGVGEVRGFYPGSQCTYEWTLETEGETPYEPNN